MYWTSLVSFDTCTLQVFEFIPSVMLQMKLKKLSFGVDECSCHHPKYQ